MLQSSDIILLGTKEIVRYSFHAKKDYELDLQKGEFVLVLDKQEDDGWSRGMIGVREGWFPADCLHECTFE